MPYFVDNNYIYFKEVLDTGHEITTSVTPLETLVVEEVNKTVRVGDVVPINLKLVKNELHNQEIKENILPYNIDVKILVNGEETISGQFKNGLFSTEFQSNVEGDFVIDIMANKYFQSFIINVREWK